MPPDDPLGRHGPSLDNFLRKRPVIPEHRKQPCPYGNSPTLNYFKYKNAIIFAVVSLWLLRCHRTISLIPNENDFHVFL